ncbi:hypothetical protein FACS1894187_05440 [Synergistales bacterium]|nr:hypothetical protein FACS1894187_05440 [Synergistales bacterium]
MQTTKLKQERLDRDWTLEYVGQQIGISNQAISQIETGKSKPSYDVLLKLLTLFDVEHKNISQLFAPVEDVYKFYHEGDYSNARPHHRGGKEMKRNKGLKPRNCEP